MNEDIETWFPNQEPLVEAKPSVFHTVLHRHVRCYTEHMVVAGCVTGSSSAILSQRVVDCAQATSGTISISDWRLRRGGTCHATTALRTIYGAPHIRSFSGTSAIRTGDQHRQCQR
jgi:hypothetical protein